MQPNQPNHPVTATPKLIQPTPLPMNPPPFSPQSLFPLQHNANAPFPAGLPTPTAKPLQTTTPSTIPIAAQPRPAPITTKPPFLNAPAADARPIQPPSIQPTHTFYNPQSHLPPSQLPQQFRSLPPSTNQPPVPPQRPGQQPAFAQGFPRIVPPGQPTVPAHAFSQLHPGQAVPPFQRGPPRFPPQPAGVTQTPRPISSQPKPLAPNAQAAMPFPAFPNALPPATRTQEAARLAANAPVPLKRQPPFAAGPPPIRPPDQDAAQLYAHQQKRAPYPPFTAGAPILSPPGIVLDPKNFPPAFQKELHSLQRAQEAQAAPAKPPLKHDREHPHKSSDQLRRDVESETGQLVQEEMREVTTYTARPPLDDPASNAFVNALMTYCKQHVFFTAEMRDKAVVVRSALCTDESSDSRFGLVFDLDGDWHHDAFPIPKRLDRSSADLASIFKTASPAKHGDVAKLMDAFFGYCNELFLEMVKFGTLEV